MKPRISNISNTSPLPLFSKSISSSRRSSLSWMGSCFMVTCCVSFGKLQLLHGNDFLGLVLVVSQSKHIVSVKENVFVDGSVWWRIEFDSDRFSSAGGSVRSMGRVARLAVRDAAVNMDWTADSGSALQPGYISDYPEVRRLVNRRRPRQR